MRRIAFFVEGRTEMLFIERLIEAVANQDQVLIEKQEVRGGGKNGKVALSYTTVGVTRPVTNEEFYVLIYDCGSEDQVKIRIAEEHNNLTKKGYEAIVGVRDVRPKFDKASLPQLRKIMRLALNKTLAPVTFILSLAEIEAWFLAEHTHFPRIHPLLTTEAIAHKLGFDPSVEDMSDRLEPAEDLHDCYQIAGRAYDKSKAGRTVNALDMAFIYAGLTERLPALKTLADTVDKFFTTPVKVA